MCIWPTPKSQLSVKASKTADLHSDPCPRVSTPCLPTLDPRSVGVGGTRTDWHPYPTFPQHYSSPISFVTSCTTFVSRFQVLVGVRPPATPYFRVAPPPIEPWICGCAERLKSILRAQRAKRASDEARLFPLNLETEPRGRWAASGPAHADRSTARGGGLHIACVTHGVQGRCVGSGSVPVASCALRALMTSVAVCVQDASRVGGSADAASQETSQRTSTETFDATAVKAAETFKLLVCGVFAIRIVEKRGRAVFWPHVDEFTCFVSV